MLPMIRRLLHLESSAAKLQGVVKARDLQIARLNDDMADLDRRLDEQKQAYKRLHAEMAGIPRDPMDPVAAALEELIVDLGSSKWDSPEGAEQVLIELVRVHYHRGWTALVSAGGKA